MTLLRRKEYGRVRKSPTQQTIGVTKSKEEKEEERD
jgi:hypothetical protein